MTTGTLVVGNANATTLTAGTLVVGNANVTTLTASTLRLTSTTVALGANAGNTVQGSDAIAVGNLAGTVRQGTYAVGIGAYAGTNSQGGYAIAIGSFSGSDYQSTSAIAIGSNSGSTSQGNSAVAIGPNSGSTLQGANAVAHGNNSGLTLQGTNAVAMGNRAGQNTQGSAAVAVGNQAGQNRQGINAVAVGANAGNTSQGSYAVAIGNAAGQTSQHSNSIVLNASVTALNSGTAGALYVNPVRNVTQANLLGYNTTTKEVSYFSLSDITTSNLVSTNITSTNIVATTLTAGTLIGNNIGVNVVSPGVSVDVLGQLNITNNSYGSPTLSTYGGVGSRIVLGTGSGSATPYALGVENNNVWFSSNYGGYKWYNNTTLNMQMTNGNLTVTGDITGFGNLSDARLKTNIIDITQSKSLEVVNALRPVTFDWKDDIFNESKRGTNDIGFIAQEVEEIIPCAVSDYVTSDVNYKHIKHERILPYLVGSIQKLTRENDELRNRLTQIESLLQK